ncbi:MAG: hypothetical protein JXA07_03820 [Spirochaetes bacterium]|nr:hypothetical protein [Spirochaetota bacterium]
MKFARIFILFGVICLPVGCVRDVVKDVGSRPAEASVVRPDGETRDECRNAIRRARIDARSGRYRLYVFGRDRYDDRFARFLAEYMKARYGIDLVLSEPGDPDRSQCYSNEMDKIIMNTFGPDVLAEAEQEARELFDSQN